ncbi:DUF1127 domain-containing protein [Actibacterium ureilyticum]|uniref:DUF1127 domain-containing protein n=1 Tax=Actibacterium ureilyticum TaxID=1590614 RepID=UPI000BAA9BF2|nr:DUF1127 domain-containing protein [Actibacterium ureilyticum]
MAHSIIERHPARAAAAGGVLPRIYRAFAVAEQRHKLAQMDDARLADIGVTRAQARAEARRPFWDVPKGWKA